MGSRTAPPDLEELLQAAKGKGRGPLLGIGTRRKMSSHDLARSQGTVPPAQWK